MGISNRDGASVHDHPKANIFAITTKKSLLLGWLVNVRDRWIE